jgi:hypothetical protein
LQYCSYPIPFTRGSVPVMLRLRPSELTLTPEDVDETLRRMAHRQALRGSRHVSPQPGRPSLRRGPQRAVRDAITTLGDIPILRPQPQQAIFTSVDDDIENDPEPQTPSSRGRVDSVSGSISPVRGEQTPREDVVPDVSSPLRTMHLPFRPGTNHRESPTHSSPVEHNPEGPTASPGHRSPRTMEDTNGRETGQHSLPTHVSTLPSPPELRGGGGPRKGHTDSSSGSQDVGSSRPHQGQNCGSANDQADATEEHPTIHLQGHFTDPYLLRKYPTGPKYWFSETTLQVPQTEPRRSSGRHAIPKRSLSSGSAPTYLRSTQRLASGSFPPQDVFGNAAEEERRRFSSETSATSAPYSIYELPPESRQSSGELTGIFQQSHPQYDGTAASEYVNRGAYHSIRPSDLQAYHNSLQHLAMGPVPGGQYGISPLPSMPYMRTQGTRALPPSFPGHHLQSARPPSHMDAATAAVRNLDSPLEPFSNHYQRINSQGPEWRTTPAPYLSPHASNNFGGAGTSAQNNITTQQNTVSRSQPGRPNSGRPQQHPAIFQYPPAGTLSNPPRHLQQPVGRGVQTTRASQRSSENAPVRPPAHSSGPSGNSQVQIHRAAFERLHNYNVPTRRDSQQGAPRHGLPPPVVPGNTSNEPHRQQTLRRVPGYSGYESVRRRTPQASSSPAPASQQPPSSQSGRSPSSGILRTSPAAPPRPPPSDEPSMRGGGARRRVTPAVRSSSLLHPPRSYPSGSIAPGRASIATSLHSPILRATTSARPLRRVPPQQRDQENSGAGEEQLMRQEEAAINARYGEDVQRDTMDETPPRVGRVERRMFS